MSMLSSLRDRLRDRAKELRSLADGLAAPCLATSTKEIMALAMIAAASDLEAAADMILELRNQCNDLMDENERLRSCLTDDADNARAILHESAELRELVFVSLNYCANGMCSAEDPCPMNTHDGKGLCGFVRKCRELGIEELDDLWA